MTYEIILSFLSESVIMKRQVSISTHCVYVAFGGRGMQGVDFRTFNSTCTKRIDKIHPFYSRPRSLLQIPANRSSCSISNGQEKLRNFRGNCREGPLTFCLFHPSQRGHRLWVTPAKSKKVLKQRGIKGQRRAIFGISAQVVSALF